jgi:hypothetical protein
VQHSVAGLGSLVVPSLVQPPQLLGMRRAAVQFDGGTELVIADVLVPSGLANLAKCLSAAAREPVRPLDVSEVPAFQH